MLVGDALAADQGIVFTASLKPVLDGAAALSLAVARSSAESRRWVPDYPLPSCEAAWEGPHSWNFLLSSGNMDTHGVVVDRYSGRCFLRMYADFRNSFDL